MSVCSDSHFLLHVHFTLLEGRSSAVHFKMQDLCRALIENNIIPGWICAEWLTECLYKEINTKSEHFSKQLRRREHCTDKCRNTLGKIPVAGSAPLSQAHSWKPFLAPWNYFVEISCMAPNGIQRNMESNSTPMRNTKENMCHSKMYKFISTFIFFQNIFYF